MKIEPIILERILELCIGFITIISFKLRFSSGSGVSIKDLLSRIEKQDREIERLRIQKRMHNYRSMQAKHKHLHLSSKRYTL